MIIIIIVAIGHYFGPFLTQTRLEICYNPHSGCGNKMMFYMSVEAFPLKCRTFLYKRRKFKKNTIENSLTKNNLYELLRTQLIGHPSWSLDELNDTHIARIACLIRLHAQLHVHAISLHAIASRCVSFNSSELQKCFPISWALREAAKNFRRGASLVFKGGTD